MEYFSADWHLGHDNIRRLCGRPFTTAEEMDRTIIARCNERVGADDTLFVLGDITFRAARGLHEYMRQIVCKNVYLVFGNHDPRHKKKSRYHIPDPDQSLFNLFVRIDKALTIRVDVEGQPQYIYLHHYACRTWDKSFHGSWHLFGHSHGNLVDDPLSLSMDVGVDAHNFYPLSLAQVTEFMRLKKRPVDAIQRQQRVEGGLQ